jgi:hypothetical protein
MKTLYFISFLSIIFLGCAKKSSEEKKPEEKSNQKEKKLLSPSEDTTKVTPKATSETTVIYDKTTEQQKTKNATSTVKLEGEKDEKKLDETAKDIKTKKNIIKTKRKIRRRMGSKGGRISKPSSNTETGKYLKNKPSKKRRISGKKKHNYTNEFQQE